jgi:hypothetical protein
MSKSGVLTRPQLILARAFEQPRELVRGFSLIVVRTARPFTFYVMRMSYTLTEKLKKQAKSGVKFSPTMTPDTSRPYLLLQASSIYRPSCSSRTGDIHIWAENVKRSAHSFMNE